jgi:hypothetical protein
MRLCWARAGTAPASVASRSARISRIGQVSAAAVARGALFNRFRVNFRDVATGKLHHGGLAAIGHIGSN